MSTINKDFLNCKRIAVFGISRMETKFGNSIYRELKSRGYSVFPMHTEMEQFDGDHCFRSLTEINPTVEGVFINVKPDKVIGILQEVKKAGIKKVWLQQGAESELALQFAKENNLSLSSNGCILMYLEPVTGLHSFHRWIWRLIKKY